MFFIFSWLISGFLAYLIMLCYRLINEGLPNNLKWYHYLPGITLALILGPFTYVLNVIILIKESTKGIK